MYATKGMKLQSDWTTRQLGDTPVQRPREVASLDVNT